MSRDLSAAEARDDLMSLVLMIIIGASIDVRAWN
jgi:hypothetical protein